MLSRRFANDRRATLELNEIQQGALSRHMLKVARGVYPTEEKPCPVCGEPGGEKLSEKDRYGVPLSVVICPRCGLIRTEPRMTQGAYTDFYQTDYREMYGGKEKPDAEFFEQQLRHGREIVALFESNGTIVGPDLLVVEVGCGAGGILKAFQERGAKAIGCDLGEEFLAYGREKAGLDLRTGFLSDLKLPGKVDIILYSHVIEHILDINHEIQCIKQALSDRGSVYIEIPSVKNINDAYRGDFLRLLQNAHTYHFSLQSLTNVMGINGFTRTYGDEYVHAIYKISGVVPYESDYDDAMRFLRRAEWMRLLWVVRPSRFKRLVRLLSRKLSLNT